MVITLGGVVAVIVYLLVAACVFALLHFLIGYVGSKFPESGPFVKVAHIVLVVLAVLVLIGLLLSFAGLAPPVTFRW
jgi:hypothetical protein